MNQETSPRPWHVVACDTPGCWCAMVVTDAGFDADSMEGCVIPAGTVSRADAELIVAAVNLGFAPEAS